MPTGFTREEIHGLETLATLHRPATPTLEQWDHRETSPKISTVGIIASDRGVFIRSRFENGSLRDFNLNCAVARDLYVGLGGLVMESGWAWGHEKPDMRIVDADLPAVDEDELTATVDIASSVVMSSDEDALVFLATTHIVSQLHMPKHIRESLLLGLYIEAMRWGWWVEKMGRHWRDQALPLIASDHERFQ